MQLSASFRRFEAPQTGRAVVQLTYGDAFHYPLYYFIPTITRDNRFLIYHKAQRGEVQLWRLELATGEEVQLTFAAAQNTHWAPWCVDKGIGVLDHRSVLNRARGSVLYYDGQDLYEVDVETLARRLVFTLPPDRIAIGQNCVTPDGAWYFYIHHDRDTYAKIMEDYWRSRHLSQNTALCAYHLESGEKRDILHINSPIHHVVPYDNEHVIFCHPAMENGMLWTSLAGGRYTHLRTQEADGGAVCHYLATRRGIMYEVLPRRDGIVRAGMYDPFTHNRAELALPRYFGYTHTGLDPEGRLWFYENEHGEKGIHDLHLLVRHDPKGGDVWQPLFGNWHTYGGGQSGHYHPQVTPDRKWILFTGGDPETKTNQIYLLDISDVADTEITPNG